MGPIHGKKTRDADHGNQSGWISEILNQLFHYKKKKKNTLAKQVILLGAVALVKNPRTGFRKGEYKQGIRFHQPIPLPVSQIFIFL